MYCDLLARNHSVLILWLETKDIEFLRLLSRSAKSSREVYDCLLVRLKSFLVINAAYLQIKLYSIISRSFCFTPQANESLSLLTRESGCCIKKQASIGLCASISYSWESPGEDECWLLLKVEGWRCSLAKAYFIVNYFSESERCFKIDVDWESNFLEYDSKIINFSHTGKLIVILEFRIQFFDINLPIPWVSSICQSISSTNLSFLVVKTFP